MGVFRHIVNMDGLHGIKRKVLRIHFTNFLHNPHPDIVIAPPCEIVQPRGIVFHLPVTVADTLQVAAIVGEGPFVLQVTERECQHRLDIGRTVQLTQVDDQMLLVTQFQGMSHVGQSQKLLPEVHHTVFRTPVRLRLLQQSHYKGTVLLGVFTLVVNTGFCHRFRRCLRSMCPTAYCQQPTAEYQQPISLHIFLFTSSVCKINYIF